MICYACILCPHVVNAHCALMLCMHVVTSHCDLTLCPHVVHARCSLMFCLHVPSCLHAHCTLMCLHVLPSCAFMFCPHVVPSCYVCMLYLCVMPSLCALIMCPQVCILCLHGESCACTPCPWNFDTNHSPINCMSNKRIFVLPAAYRPSITICMCFFFLKSFAKAFPIFMVQAAHTDGPAVGWKMTSEVTHSSSMHDYKNICGSPG